MNKAKAGMLGIGLVGALVLGTRLLPSAKPKEAVTPAAGDFSQKISRQNEEKLTAIRQVVAKQSPTEAQPFDRILTEIWPLHFSINRVANYDALAQDLLQRPEVVRDLQSILLNLEKTRERFGDKQAEARVVAVDLLASMAKQGHPEPLLATQVALNQARVLGENYEEKQDIDRLDLLRSYIIARGPELVNDIPHFLEETGFTPALAKDYYNLLWVWLKGRMDKEELRKKLAFFDQYSI